MLYAIAGWVILQVADVLFEALDLPASSVRLVIGMLILGFQLVVAADPGGDLHDLCAGCDRHNCLVQAG